MSNKKDVPVLPCAACGKRLNTHVAVNCGPELQPEVGSVVICGHCCAVNQVGQGNTAVVLSDEQQRKLFDVKFYLEVQHAKIATGVARMASDKQK